MNRDAVSAELLEIEAKLQDDRLAQRGWIAASLHFSGHISTS